MLFLLVASAAASSMPPPPPDTAPKSCVAPGIISAKNMRAPHGLRRLDEDPPASQYLAVVRQVGGCPVPAIVRTGIGR